MAEQSNESERLTRLEEATLFSERRLDELHEEVLALSKLVDALGSRLRAIELARLSEAEDASGAEAGPDPAPSSP
jgi:hypothetical protein